MAVTINSKAGSPASNAGAGAAAGSGGGVPVTLSGGRGVGSVVTATPAAGWTFTTGQWYVDGAAVNGQTALTYTRQLADIGKSLWFVPTGLPYRADAGATLADVPGAPTIGTLTAGNMAVTGAFTAPASNGGAAITNYVMSVYRSSDNVLLGQANSATSPATLSGIANGVAVYCKFAAQNSVGTGLQSTASNVVTPSAVIPSVPFDPAVAFTAGQQVSYAGGIYSFTADHPAGNWTGNDVTYLRQSGARTLNTVGFSKPLGIVGNWVSGTMASTTTTVAAGTRGAKCQMEAPFTKLRIVRYHREAAPIRGLAVSVASTETDSVSGISNSVDPIVGGVAYNVLRANSQYGFARVTWGGQPRSPVQAPGGVSPPGQGYMTHLSTTISDWVDCNSVPPLNGKLPMVVMRYNDLVNAGDAGSSASQGTLGAFYNAYLAGTPTARFLFAPGVGAGDHVADPTLSRSSATMYDPALYNSGFWANIGIAAEHGIPTRVFVGFGDSITEGYSWWQNAVYTLSTQKAPCYVANFGCSTNRSAQYLEVLKTQLREENYFTDVILPSFSPNEVQAMTNTLADGFIAGLQEAIELCRVYNKRLYIWTSYAQYTTRYAANGTSVNAIKRINDWVRTEAAKPGALFNLIEIADGWDNATMIVTANSDFTHPNATAGIPYMTSRCLPAIQLGA